jgi:hypothetical protein
MESRYDPDGRRLPIKLDSTSNGEIRADPAEPVPRGALCRDEAASANARVSG